MRTITIGRREAEICATCEYWQGGNLIQSAGSISNPSKMNLNDRARFTQGTCINRKCTRSGTQSCGEHEYRYDLKRYL